MDVRDLFQSLFNVVDWAGLGGQWWSRGDSCFMKHLLLSCLGPVGVPRIEETTRGVFDSGFLRLV